MNSAPIVDVNNATVGAVTVFQDISAIKALDREKDEFLASASHDLKTPLASIEGTAQMLDHRLSRAGSIDLDRLSAGLKSIDAIVNRMATQLDQLLDVARLRMGREIMLDRQATDMVGLVRETVELAQATTEHHVLQVETDSEAVIGHWDADRLRRVLTNLLSNAVKYSPAGGDIVVQVAREIRGSKGTAIVSVQDRGIGIPPEDVPHTFQRFRRGGNIAGIINGTGIGLADVDQIVQLHGGTVTVESDYRKGSTFIMRLPLAAASTQSDSS